MSLDDSEQASDRGEEERGERERRAGRGPRERGAERGRPEKGAGAEKGAEARRGEEARGAAERGGSGGPGRALLRRSALAAARVYYFRALPRLRAALHNKIYFKTQLKETGRLHVTVSLTYPAPAPNREAPSDSRGDSEARELGRKKNI